MFWGGSAIDGKKNPLKSTSQFETDFRRGCTNQVMPLFLSNKGRYIWSENPFKIEIKDGIIQTQEGVLSYANKIIEHGFKPGILIIDEGWQKEYGVWEFDKLKFPDPKAMIDKLHKMGFTLLIWVVPWVRPDGFDFVMNTNKYVKGVNKNWDKLFLRDAKNDFAMMLSARMRCMMSSKSK